VVTLQSADNDLVPDCHCFVNQADAAAQQVKVTANEQRHLTQRILSGQPSLKMFLRNMIGHGSRLDVILWPDVLGWLDAANHWHQQRGRRNAKRHSQSQ
jgi:hypothetical protein